MAGGRPTDYTQEIIDKAKSYLTEWENQGQVIPSVAGLASFLKIARSTIYEWATHEDKAEFSDILEGILSLQEEIALNKGLSNDFNSTIVKLLLGKHGYSDKAETQLTGAKGGPIQVEPITFVGVNKDSD